MRTIEKLVEKGILEWHGASAYCLGPDKAIHATHTSSQLCSQATATAAAFPHTGKPEKQNGYT